jgi:SPX domain protein involved in polyphosphate accumulation
MKFGVHLLTNLTSEWNSQYIQYEYMKELLEKTIAEAPIIVDGDDNPAREQYFLRADEPFFQVRTIAICHSLSIHLFTFL